MDSLEMAFPVSERDNEEKKLRGVAWVLREEARRWYQVLPDKDKVTCWKFLKGPFLPNLEAKSQWRSFGENFPASINNTLETTSAMSPHL